MENFPVPTLAVYTDTAPAFSTQSVSTLRVDDIKQLYVRNNAESGSSVLIYGKDISEVKRPIRVNSNGELVVESQDAQSVFPENIVTTITSSGTIITLHRTDTKDIQVALVKNPSKGLRANTSSAVLYITLDGQAPLDKGTSLNRGEFAYFLGDITQSNGLKLDSNISNVNAEVILWG